MPIVRILHLSDLRGCGATPTPTPVSDAKWSALLDEVAQVGPVDLMCLTGDLSHSGQHDELVRLNPLLRRTCTRLRITPDHLFVVPGDHDVDHRHAREALEGVRSHFEREPIAVTAWMTGQAAAPGDVDPTWKPAVLGRQEAFWRWLRDDLNQLARPLADAIGYHAALPIPEADAPVHVFGLNASWLADGASAEQVGVLGSGQIAHLLQQAEGDAPRGLRVALMHHPCAALADREHCEAKLAEAVDLVLCGPSRHRHLTPLGTGHVHQLAAGPLARLDASPSCQLVQIETDRAGATLGFAARVWIWSAGEERWISEAPLPGAIRGRLFWRGAQPPPSPPGGRPWTLAELFTRLFASAEELRRWLRWRVPEIHPDLPGGTVSLRALASDAAEVLERVGAVDSDLLDALADTSPSYGAAIMALPTGARPTAMVAALTQALAVKPSKPTRREGPELHPGDVLPGDRYRLRGVLGAGGFGTVWRAHDMILDREVAIKILNPQLAREPARRDQFLRGARAMQALKHEAVVRVLNPHGGDLPQPFFVMEVIDGINLHEAVTGGRWLSLREVVTITCKIGDALTDAHARGMIHRGIKPTNILLDERGNPHLTDFDLVRAHDTTGGTQTGGMGTFVYAAPELVQNAEDADARADIYGLGMTSLFMLYGDNPPYMDTVRNPAAVLARVAAPGPIKKIILRAIAWDRKDRFATVEHFCRELKRAQSVATGSRITSRPARAGELWLLAIVATALVTLVILAAWRGRVEPTPFAAPSETSIARVEPPPRSPSPAIVSGVRSTEDERESSTVASATPRAQAPTPLPTEPPAQLGPTAAAAPAAPPRQKPKPASPRVLSEATVQERLPAPSQDAPTTLSDDEVRATLVRYVKEQARECCLELQREANEPETGDCDSRVRLTISLQSDVLRLTPDPRDEGKSMATCLEQKAASFRAGRLSGLEHKLSVTLPP